jgi:hypothetical protein
MALGNAIDFVKRVPFDKELKRACDKCVSRGEMLSKLDFNELEFEDALNMQLVKCQTYEQAEVFQQIKLWFLLF